MPFRLIAIFAFPLEQFFVTRDFPIFSSSSSFFFFIFFFLSHRPSALRKRGKGLQKDLGVILSFDMQWRPHYTLITQRAYKMLGLTRRTFHLVIDVCAKHRLYLSLIRSHLLYCSPLWRPQLLLDIKNLETVQRRATKYITGNPSLDYRERLLSLHMLPLMMEYEIADILFFIKSLKEPSHHFNIEDYIQFNVSNTRSSSYLKLRHSISQNNLQGHFFFNRLPRLWNSLPLLDISLSIPAIRTKLREHFWNHFIVHFDSNNVCTYHYLCPCVNCTKLPVKSLFTPNISTGDGGVHRHQAIVPFLLYDTTTKSRGLQLHITERRHFKTATLFRVGAGPVYSADHTCFCQSLQLLAASTATSFLSLVS